MTGRVLVTGGGGFLGGAVVRLLLARGDEVRSLARGDYPALRALGVDARRGDLADAEAVDAAVRGCDAVVHAGARAGAGVRLEPYRLANVVGTRNVVAACRRHGVGRLVHTSTPSVVHTGADLHAVDETAPVAARFDAPYPATKAEAERVVLAADSPSLATTALRPHLVWGPGDTHLVPQLVARARSGRLRLVGDGRALVDTTYVDNAADAHVAALDALGAAGAGGAPRGRAYFVSNGEPRPVAAIVNAILAAHGLPPEHRTVPLGAAVAVGAVVEAVWTLLRRDDDPPMTRFLARQLATAHHFDLTAARRDLGWEPRVTIDEGLARLAEAVAAHRPITARRLPFQGR